MMDAADLGQDFKAPTLIWLKTFPHCDEADVYEPFHHQSQFSTSELHPLKLTWPLWTLGGTEYGPSAQL